MAKKVKSAAERSSVRPLEAEDLDQIVGGAATQQEYDTAKESLLHDINNTDFTNALAAAAASISSDPGHIAGAISDIEAYASANHLSTAAALAALDAATYGNAKVGGVDMVAAELTKVLTNNSAEADMAHLAAQGADPATLVHELSQAVQILAMGSADGHTALGLSTADATHWVEAKLETAAIAEAAADTAASAREFAQAGAGPDWFSMTSFANHLNAGIADLAMAEKATALQSYLDTTYQGQVAEGKGIDAVMTAIGTHAAEIAADAAALRGLTGDAAVTAGLAEADAVQHIAGVQKDIALVALDLFAQGNAGVQQALAHELASGAIEVNLAQAVATGQLTGDQAVLGLNTAVADLAHNSINANTIPALEEGFAIANADVALANAAAALAAADLHAAQMAASGYGNPADAPSLQHQAQLASSLQTLINTSYAGEVALANELNSIAALLGPNAVTYEQYGTNLIGNPGLAAGYINEIENAAKAAEASAAPGALHGAFSVDAALTLLAAYSHGNPAVLAELDARLVNGSAEKDIAHLVALGALTPAQGLTTLTGMIDALAAASPTNSVTLTDSNGHSITLDRNSALDWAEGQLAKAVLPMQSALGQAMVDFAASMLSLNNAQIAAATQALQLATAEAPNVFQLVSLLETSHADEIVKGLGIDTAWTAASAGADAAAVIAAGTHMVQSGYGPMPQVDPAAQAQADAINRAAGQHEMANYDIAQQIMQAKLAQVWDANIAQGQDAAAAAVNDAGDQFVSDMKSAGFAIYNEFDLFAFTDVATNPSFQNFVNLGIDIGVQIVAPWEASVADLGLQGMAALMRSDAVSSVIGERAAGDLATGYQALHNALGGAITLFNDWALIQGQAAIELGQDAVKVAGSAVAFGDDLAHGNFDELAGDAQQMFTDLGNATLHFAEDYIGNALIGVPLPKAEAMFNDLVSKLGTLYGDLMSNGDFAAAVSAIQDEGQKVLSYLEDQIGSDAAAALGDAYKSTVGWLQGAEHEAESIWDDIKDGFEDFGDDLNPSNW